MDTSGLYPYQEKAALSLLEALRTHGAALDASDTGTGKTAHAVSLIRHFNAPALVVGPRVSKPGWEKMGRILGTEFSYTHYEAVRIGTMPYGQWQFPRPKRLKERLVCSVCQCDIRPGQPCPYHSLGIHCANIKKVPHKHGRFIWSPAIKFLLFDEAHRCAAPNSTHAELLIAAKRQGILTLAISATAGDSPLHFRALGYLLGLHNLIDFWPWTFKRGCSKMPFGGIHFAVAEQRKVEIMSQLNAEIFPSRGARVRVDEIPGFPEISVWPELYDIDAKPGQIDALYEEMADAIAKVHGDRDMDNDLPVTSDMRARQEVELLKVPAMVEITNDDLASGRHVAIFVNFRATAEELCKRLETDCRIDGSQVGEAGSRRRQANIERFQSDESPVIVATSAAGNVSIDLHDTHGNFPRIGNVFPGHSVREFTQLLGRLRRSGAKSKALYRIILAAGTCEEEIYDNLGSKTNRLDALLDSDFMPR